MEQSDPERRVMENSLSTIRGVQRRLDSTRAELGELTADLTEPVRTALDDALALLRMAVARLQRAVEHDHNEEGP